MESPEENCAALVKNVLIQQLHLPAEIVHSMKFCGAHHLGKQNANKTRPLIVRFPCRSDRELVWKNRFHLKDSSVASKTHSRYQEKSISSSFAKDQEKNPRAKASAIGNKLIVNGKRYFHYDVPKEWLLTMIPIVNGSRVNMQPQEDNNQEET